MSTTALWIIALAATAVAVRVGMVALRRAVRRGVAEERARIARELHDSIAQGMTGVGLHVECALAAIGDGVPAAANLRSAKVLTRTTLLDVKRILLDLTPAPLEGRELAEAIRDMLRKLTDGLPVTACVRVEGKARILDPATERDVFRIAQEAVTNSLRHSRSRRIEVVLDYAAGGLRLSVRDDGAGSGVHRREDLIAAASAGDGQGMAGMHERARRLGGTLTTHFVARGMEIVLEVPA